MILDSAGNLYGTTYWGGSPNAGVVSKVSAAGQETVLYTFTGGADGDSEGNFYGDATYGGAYGEVAVYELDAAGDETALYSFTVPSGAFPVGSLVQDSAGQLLWRHSFGWQPSQSRRRV